MDHIGLLLQHSQYVYAIPVGIVLVCAILVFAFGFKKAEQPPFAQLSAGSDVDRKLAKKRGKVREKVSETTSVTRDPAARPSLSLPLRLSFAPRPFSPVDTSRSPAIWWLVCGRESMHTHTRPLISWSLRSERVARKVALFLLPALRDVTTGVCFLCQRGPRRPRHVPEILVRRILAAYPPLNLLFFLSTLSIITFCPLSLFKVQSLHNV